MNKLKQLIIQYRAVILYLIFGVFTTFVNLFVYYACSRWLYWPTMPSTILAWFMAVFFAYITNRRWVFGSKESTASGIAKEIGRFFGCRVATGVVDWLCMFIFVDVFAWNDMIIKFGANILVVILNYLASRLIIFRRN